ncbi:PTB domain-containing engulfment adapter protein 1-like [Alosa sapidissima]|uniref:PTB domain-containing engulfment adapter protein 1-like n=1 Tax=Alosa sapidissima TaxID=34773 RepID=UPI001C091791|nr:PTB domain-containing engulfment adapter protein 1-like [Alosa sapidissima]XP_041955037.1 PTB domain-containing engulfment adapter protein 1-like [Alosa sapidissima]
MIESEDNEISFIVKFLGRIEVRRPDGMQILNEAAGVLLNPDKNDKETAKKSKAYLFLSVSGIDILEYKTKFMMHSCRVESVSFCAVHQTMPKLFGFIAKNPASDMYHCYMFQCKKFSHLVVSLIGDTFKACSKQEKVRGSRDLVVEALRLRIKALQRENELLKRRLREAGGSSEGTRNLDGDSDAESSSHSQSDLSKVRFNSDGDRVPLIRNR